MLRTMLVLFMGTGAMGFGVVAWVATHPAPPPAVVVPPVSVLAAAGTLRAGSLLRPEDVEALDVVAAEAPAGARRDSPQARAELFGAMVRQTLLAHQVVLPADVMRPGDHGFLAAVLAPGMRATSIGVDAISGTAGLIWPGDHVDLILTQDVRRSAGEVIPHITAETVLADVRVIAIDQQMVQGGNAAAGEKVSRTVTLEVSPDDAKRVAIATQLGRLSLAVLPVGAVASGSGRLMDEHEVTQVVRPVAEKPLPVVADTHVWIYSGGVGQDFHFP